MQTPSTLTNAGQRFSPCRALRWASGALSRHFSGEPTVARTYLVFLLVVISLFARSPATNYIFDEQEALLANPYVNRRNLRFIDAIHVDFWGLAADRSVGSYRPLPNFIWRLLWHVTESPFVHHLPNLFLHALNASLIARLAYQFTRRPLIGHFAGIYFASCAVLTEAVTGIVGIADVLGGTGALVAVSALSLPLFAMPVGVFLGVTFSLFAKESGLVCVPLVPLVAVLVAPFAHSKRPIRLVRGVAAFAASVGAFVLYVELRKRWFASPLPRELDGPLDEGASRLAHLMRGFLVWFHQAPLPRDPFNNPLADAPFTLRVAGALRVYYRSLLQLLVPLRLSGDYSFSQEPVPERAIFFESVAGATAMVLPLLFGFGLGLWSMMRHPRRKNFADAPNAGGTLALVAAGLLWVVISYFPHSNIPIVLPTVRAERFLYFPAMGAALCLSVAFTWFIRREETPFFRRLLRGVVVLFFLFQAVQAYGHTMDYRSDLNFWRATKEAVPRSAKAHLNYSVMVGARGDLQARLIDSEIAVEIAPEWAMAWIYTGDTLCRLHRVEEAWPYYLEGLERGPNEQSLVALALQCLYDEGELETYDAELRSLAAADEGSWVAYLAVDTLDNGVAHDGVDPKYRPRNYNEGPKE